MSNEFDESISKITKEEISGRGVAAGYRALNLLAVIAFVLSLFTPLMLLNSWFFLFPLFGALCGIWGLYNILTCPFDYTGRSFAFCGILFSFVLGIAAGGWGVYQYYFNVPFGYTSVEFLQLLKDDKTDRFSDDILNIVKERRKVYIKGYMYPGKQMSGIQNFMLVRTQEHCKYCSPQQNPFDMISIHFKGDLTATFRTKPVFIGGELYLNEDFKYGELPYHIEADLFR